MVAHRRAGFPVKFTALSAIRDDPLHRIEEFGHDDETERTHSEVSYALSSSSSVLASLRSAVSKPSVNQP